MSRNFSSESTIFDDKSKIKTKLQKIIYLVVSSHASNIFEKNLFIYNARLEILASIDCKIIFS